MLRIWSDSASNCFVHFVHEYRNQSTTRPGPKALADRADRAALARIAELAASILVSLRKCGRGHYGSERQLRSWLTEDGISFTVADIGHALQLLERTQRLVRPEVGRGIPDLVAAFEATRQAVTPDFMARQLLPRLMIKNVDELDVRKATEAPVGLISWLEGQRLVRETEQFFKAGAKGFMQPRRTYSNRFGAFANRFLDTVFMGQTDIGSFIVSAYIPADEVVSLRGSGGRQGTRDNFVTAHDVTRCIGYALEATREALDHYRKAGRLSGFVDRVNDGISRELISAVKGICVDADEADVTITWNKGTTGLTEEETRVTRVEFSTTDVPILERAANELAIDQPEERVALSGYVHCLSRKEVSSPGTIGLDIVGREIPNRVRVHVPTNSQYHLAVTSHDLGRLVYATGNLQREGNIWCSMMPSCRKATRICGRGPKRRSVIDWSVIYLGKSGISLGPFTHQSSWPLERREWWVRVRGADGRQRWIRAVDLRPASGAPR